MAASSRFPTGTLPPVSITATPLSPITKPMLAMSPRFSSLIRAISPVWTNTPGATSCTGSGASVSPHAAPCAARTRRRARGAGAPCSQRHRSSESRSLAGRRLAIHAPVRLSGFAVREGGRLSTPLARDDDLTHPRHAIDDHKRKPDRVVVRSKSSSLRSGADRSPRLHPALQPSRRRQAMRRLSRILTDRATIARRRPRL